MNPRQPARRKVGSMESKNPLGIVWIGTDEGTTADGKKIARGSWEDTDRIWVVSGEDPWSTYRYAGAAAHLAYAYQLAGVKKDPDGVDWQAEAIKAYAWARANTRPGDEESKVSRPRDPRAYAAACLSIPL